MNEDLFDDDSVTAISCRELLNDLVIDAMIQLINQQLELEIIKQEKGEAGENNRD